MDPQSTWESIKAKLESKERIIQDELLELQNLREENHRLKKILDEKVMILKTIS